MNLEPPEIALARTQKLGFRTQGPSCWRHNFPLIQLQLNMNKRDPQSFPSVTLFTYFFPKLVCRSRASGGERYSKTHDNAELVRDFCDAVGRESKPNQQTGISEGTGRCKRIHQELLTDEAAVGYVKHNWHQERTECHCLSLPVEKGDFLPFCCPHISISSLPSLLPSFALYYSGWIFFLTLINPLLLQLPDIFSKPRVWGHLSPSDLSPFKCSLRGWRRDDNGPGRMCWTQTTG